MIEIELNLSSQKSYQIDICSDFLTNKMCDSDNRVYTPPPQLRESTQKLTFNPLPEKNKLRYEKTYRDFAFFRAPA
jgi:hypothetical protein